MQRELLGAKTKKGFRAPKSYGELFTGLRPEDFSEDVTGTHWRSREQLGGAVTRALEVREVFDSWSIYRRSEVHWASDARYRSNDSMCQTKYIVRVSQHELIFGLYLEHSKERSVNRDDWLRFLAWTGDPEHCRWLHHTLLRTGATLTNPYPTVRDLCFYGSVVPHADGTFHHDAAKPSIFAATELPAFLSSLRDDLSLNLFICRRISREEAIALGTRIGSTIGDFFMILLPVYESKRPDTEA